MDSAFAEIKLKLITPNGCISACGQVKNFIGIKSAQRVEWRLKKLLILAEAGAEALRDMYDRVPFACYLSGLGSLAQRPAGFLGEIM